MYVIIHVIILALMMICNSLKLNKLDQNVLELRKIVCREYKFNISAFVGLIAWIAYYCKAMNNFKKDATY
jgi:hypothetical protein